MEQVVVLWGGMTHECVAETKERECGVCVCRRERPE